MLTLSKLDIFVIVSYIFAVIGIGIFTRRSSSKNEESFLLAGRRLTLPLFIGTLVSTYYGGIIGISEISYTSGLYTWLTQGIFWYISYIIFALFLAVRLRTSNQYTLPDQLDRFYGKTARKIGLVLNFLNVLPLAYVISLGVMFQILFGIPLTWGIVLGGVLSMSYTLLGGFSADVYTDLLQFVLMCVGVALLILFSYANLGGWEYLISHAPATHFTLKGGQPWTEIFIWGFIAMTTLVDPNFYQRCYAAKSPEVARKGILLSVLFWMMFDLCTTFAGIYARATFSDIDPKHAYIHLANLVFPTGLKGLYITGMLATIMSTVDSYFFVAATTLSRDLYQKILSPTASEKQVVWVTRLGIFVTGTVSILLGLYFNDSIKLIWKLFGSLMASSLLVPLLMGFWYPGPKTPNAGVASMCSGLLVAGFFYCGNKFFHIPWCALTPPLYPALIASFLAFVIVNFLGRKTT